MVFSAREREILSLLHTIHDPRADPRAIESAKKTLNDIPRRYRYVLRLRILRKAAKMQKDLDRYDSISWALDRLMEEHID